MDINEASMVYNYFDKKFSGGINSGIMSNQKIPEELHKLLIRKFEKRKVYSSCKDSIWGADLADIQLISKYKKAIRFLLCIFDMYSKCA